MSALQNLFEALWSGQRKTTDPGFNPFTSEDILEEVATGVGFYKGFVNLTVIRTEEGAVLIDTGGFHPAMRARTHATVRSFTDARIHTVVYTHGHADHAYGMPPFLDEARGKGWAQPSIIGHRAVRPRMERYTETAGYNSVINQRQFGFPMQWPTDHVYPTLEYDARLDLNVGDRRFELRHARGETDDHTYVFLPTEKLLFCGDLIIWAAPNAGNPQKVQRYALEWARALRKMAALGAETLFPGHGVPVFGAARVHQVLSETAEYLQSVYDQTLGLINVGATIYDVIHSLKIPSHLQDRPYLLPVYDEPEFIARNVYRCLAGWYSGIPSELKPATFENQAREIVALAGGIAPMLKRAEAVLLAGDIRLACHLIDWASAAEPASKEISTLRARIYTERCSIETSLMAKGIFGAAARESNERSSG